MGTGPRFLTRQTGENPGLLILLCFRSDGLESESEVVESNQTDLGLDHTATRSSCWFSHTSTSLKVRYILASEIAPTFAASRAKYDTDLTVTSIAASVGVDSSCLSKCVAISEACRCRRRRRIRKPH